jgi:hypothetical protein
MYVCSTCPVKLHGEISINQDLLNAYARPQVPNQEYEDQYHDRTVDRTDVISFPLTIDHTGLTYLLQELSVRRKFR